VFGSSSKTLFDCGATELRRSENVSETDRRAKRSLVWGQKDQFSGHFSWEI